VGQIGAQPNVVEFVGGIDVKLARSIHLVLVSLIALFVGFAGSGIAWGQAPGS